MKLEAKKALLVRDILTEVNDMEFLKKLQKAFERIKSQTMKEEDAAYVCEDEKMELSRRQYRAGDFVVCKTAEEAVKHLEAL